ncbi:CGI-121-domain-containing protein [Lentithecium fluviatile CBS 122367]|uniref:EKC/KEOPS complex subunit CGI121 n=1 Tax=Lentithecium fluviatile CBS 122367 TaxID=1168545 RepID=A0A6G1IPI2_9PLEO|nr:CGI-121-domain-containing protein [Lentithecium fluviatile CBS 122367]
MAQVRTITLPHFPAHPLQIALYKSVTNAAHLRTQLLSANPTYDYAFLDATMILSPRHLLLAAALALHAHLQGTTKTRTPHSELVFRLHPNNNIGESYRKFGIGDSTSEIVVVKFSLADDVTRESVGRHLGEVVRGTSVEIREGGEELGMWADEGKIRKVYKLNGHGGGKKGAMNGAAKDERGELESVILGSITLKGS